jgi:HPt (histidine-containing phosphotransfer) domain-containing protein
MGQAKCGILCLHRSAFTRVNSLTEVMGDREIEFLGHRFTLVAMHHTANVCWPRMGLSMARQFSFDPTLPVIERETLEEIVEIFGSDDPTAVLDLIDTFLTESSRQYDEMYVALDSGDWVKLHRMAHSLKSSSATFGAMRLSGISALIEQAAKMQCTHEDCAELLAMLSTAHQAACIMLRQERDRFASS